MWPFHATLVSSELSAELQFTHDGQPTRLEKKQDAQSLPKSDASRLVLPGVSEA